MRLTKKRVVFCRYNAYLLAMEGLLQGRGKEKPMAKQSEFLISQKYESNLLLFLRLAPLGSVAVFVFEQFQALLSQTNI